MDFIKLVNDEFKSGKEHPKFTIGDTITIEYRIKEGNRTYPEVSWNGYFVPWSW